jgi:DNA repair protein RadC
VSYLKMMEEAAAYVEEVRPKLDSPYKVAEFMRPIMLELKQEELWVICLDAKNRVIKAEMVTRGLLDRSQAHCREVFYLAIKNQAAKVVLCHNHPSGDPEPSALDMGSTRELSTCGKTLGIELVDHVVLGKKCDHRPHDHVSMRERRIIG